MVTTSQRTRTCGMMGRNNISGSWCVVFLIVSVVLIQSSTKCSADSGFQTNVQVETREKVQDNNTTGKNNNTDLTHNDSKAKSNAETPQMLSQTTIVYSTTMNDEGTTTVTPTWSSAKDQQPTTTNQPEEIIFIASTSLKKEARQRKANPVFYGTPSGRALFSPRMEYNEWTPVGRGDPLKNDPTYDYSPPVLDRVRYWESGKDKSGDILLLGVSSKKASLSSHRNGGANGNNNKEGNYYGGPKNQNSIPMRRNYYMQNLPTILMPPPMQAPTQAPVGETWPVRMAVQDQSTGQTTYISVKANNSPHPNKLPYLHSILQKEITRPQPFSMKLTPPPAAPQTPSSHGPVMSPSMLMASPSSPAPFVMHHSPSVYESHSTQTTPLGSLSSMMPPPHHDYMHRPLTMMMPPPPVVHDGMPISAPTPLPMHAIQSSRVQFMSETTTTTSTPGPIISAMTTDSYFSHYNQPKQPIGGPMYLIIEGHSKVKTYGQGDEAGAHAPKIVPVLPTEDPVITHVGSETPMVKHLHKKEAAVEEEREKKSDKTKIETKGGEMKMDGLLSFIDSSLGDFLRAEEDDENSVLEVNVEKSKKKDVKN